VDRRDARLGNVGVDTRSGWEESMAGAGDGLAARWTERPGLLEWLERCPRSALLMSRVAAGVRL
jgi:hypothetical protein